MAPLSVHRPGRGTRTRMPRAEARSCGQRPQPGVGGHAAADEQVLDALRSAAASTALRVSTSQTASWNDAATSATGTGSPEASRASTQRATAVFRPENEKSKRCRSRSRREVSPRGKSIALTTGRTRPSGRCRDRRGTAARAAGPPCRTPPPPRRRWSPRAARPPTGDVADLEQRRVPAGDQQGQARLGQRTVLELVDGHVGGEVVDAVQRLVQPERQRLGRGHADEQGAGQSGSAGHGDRVDVVEAYAGGLGTPARCVGTIASRCARDATSGTTPAEARVLLDRADATASASSVGRARCRHRSRRRTSRCRARAGRHRGSHRTFCRPAASDRQVPGAARDGGGRSGSLARCSITSREVVPCLHVRRIQEARLSSPPSAVCALVIGLQPGPVRHPPSRLETRSPRAPTSRCSPTARAARRGRARASPTSTRSRRPSRTYYGAPATASRTRPTSPVHHRDERHRRAQWRSPRPRAAAPARHHQKPAIVLRRRRHHAVDLRHGGRRHALQLRPDAPERRGCRTRRSRRRRRWSTSSTRPRSMGFAIFGLTGRNDAQKAATLDNLTKVGYTPFTARQLLHEVDRRGHQPAAVLHHLRRRELHDGRVQGGHPQAHRDTTSATTSCSTSATSGPTCRAGTPTRCSSCRTRRTTCRSADLPGLGRAATSRRARSSRWSRTARAAPPRAARASRTSTR